MNSSIIQSLLLALLLPAALSARAQESAAADPLTLQEAAWLALERQPRIEAWQAQARAERAAAIAERQLPDPRLMAGVRDFPINGPAAYSFSQDDFTMLELGFSQDLPLDSKRRLMSEQREHEAGAAEAIAEQMRREVRRDAGLAWIEVFLSERSAVLTETQGLEAERLAQATEIAFRAGRAPQSEVLSARVAVELLRDRAASERQQAREARSLLSRWIGEQAEKPLPEELPVVPAPAQLAELMRHVETHPHIEALARQQAAAASAVALAEKAYRPDWSVDAYYGNRPDFPDYVGLRLKVDLPVFTARRQDRRLEESRARLERVQAEREDVRREQAAEALAALVAWQETQARLVRFDARIVPQARTAAQAAQAAYAAGRNALTSVLQARQALLDAELRRLELAVNSLRAQLRLQYFFE